uniref:Spindle and kinetochore associated complex subunit 2 n=1 Tax=Chelonoidis abingdonii TaxID=106734 RepID=A0A8C0GYF9_CHEAB
MGELMGFLFQKAESDLDYIQHKLEFEILKNLPDNPSIFLDPSPVFSTLTRWHCLSKYYI